MPIPRQRISSRRVALTTAFLTLAAGGTAACDAPSEYEYDGEGDSATYVQDTGGGGSVGDPYAESDEQEYAEEEEYVEDEAEEAAFYCADADGTVVDEANCDTGRSGSAFFLWYSAAYAHSYGPGQRLPAGGTRLKPGDRTARTDAGLPATGRVDNGTVRTGLVGRGGSTGGDSGSAGG